MLDGKVTLTHIHQSNRHTHVGIQKYDDIRNKVDNNLQFSKFSEGRSGAADYVFSEQLHYNISFHIKLYTVSN
jgi:hypothetical protein